MRALKERDYDEMAERVVDRFMQKGVKLADGALEEASQGQLNPDQIERLVQAANTMAFLRLMDARKAEGAPDMTHEFEPAETRSVLQSLIGAGPALAESGKPEVPIAPSDDLPLPDEQGDRQRGGASLDEKFPLSNDKGPFPSRRHQDAAGQNTPPDKPPARTNDKDIRKEAMIRDRRLTKLASVFDDQLIEAETSFDDGFVRLTQAFKLAHGAPTFDTFEKDAMSVEGDEYGLAVLNLLRKSRGLSLNGSDTLEKCAALHDRHVPNDSPALREFRSLVKIARQAERVRRGVSHVRSLCG